MKIEHIALWSKNIEALKHFYVHYFNATHNDMYVNTTKGFSSYFLTFDSGARLEIMQMDTIPANANDPYQQHTGLIHIAFSLGSEKQVDDLTKRLQQDGYKVLDGPRRTGDGYYESTVLDPENNRLEITA
ncbi:VOC family protein [Photobacterium sanguinicancri]|uniref:VOC family protein n=1 Tax=Photobacterium sanguinicancri TaxID=875932 RepID=A0AAW7Y1A0_9GAMM|nr:VOC family protein [Photobacterium sanguinicancri]KXI21916.1 glyoxalase [Photobacterium sanguinicancri]MDO6541845.1 VOC family protein [Photobacterium sanguinicancri]